jgi:hypothetical protein
MSRPRFLADHVLNEHIVDGSLRREPSIEFIRARDVGLDDRTDPEVLAYAAAEGWLIVSHDVNTMPAHAWARLAAGQSLAGLFMVRQTDPIGPIIDSLVLIWSASKEADLIASRREGQQSYYFLNTTVVQDLLALIWDLFAPPTDDQKDGPP